MSRFNPQGEAAAKEGIYQRKSAIRTTFISSGKKTKKVGSEGSVPQSVRVGSALSEIVKADKAACTVRRVSVVMIWWLVEW